MHRINAVILAAAIAVAWMFLLLSIDEKPSTNPYRLGGSLERWLIACARRFKVHRTGSTTYWASTRCLIFMHIMIVVGCAAALWWFLFPDSPGEAVADSLKAAGAAIYAELWVMRLKS